MRKAVGGEYGKNSRSFDEHIGRKLRELRMAAKLSQGVLGKAIGVSFQQIQKFEAGHNRITAGQLWLLCHFLDVPVTSLLEGANIKMFRPQEWSKPARASGRAARNAKKSKGKG